MMTNVKVKNERYNIAEATKFVKEEWTEGRYKIYEVVGITAYAIIGQSITSRELKSFKPTEPHKLFWA